MPPKRRRSLRKEFLLESNQTVRARPKVLRNRTLNMVFKFLWLKKISSLFQGSALATMLITLMVGFIIFALFSPYFTIKRLSIIRDNPNINTEEIQKTLKNFYGQNLFLLDREGLRSALFENFPEFRNVEIHEIWPAELELKIKLSPPLFTLLNAHDANFSVISEDGIILLEQPDADLPLVKIIDFPKTLLPGELLASAEQLESITQAQKLIQEQLDLSIKEVRWLPIAQEVHFITQKDTALWVDLQIDFEPQIRKLVLGADEINFFTKSLEHVDLRIPNQIFWR